MGRFASTAEFYAKYREPYGTTFFPKVAEALGWNGSERLLDVGCGPGLLTIGFAPFVAEAVGIDPEPAMLKEAQEAGISATNTTFVRSRLEEFASAQRFDVITIGRALHWLDRNGAVAKLEELLSPNGWILVCGASTLAGELSPWLSAYNNTRRKWVTEDESITRGSTGAFFAASQFGELRKISVVELHTVTLDDLVWRALSRSNTSPDVLGARRAQFETELRESLAPFAQGSPSQEQVVSVATAFARHKSA